MGWDDAPPTKEEMTPSWDSAPPRPEELPPKSLGEFGTNVLMGIGRNINPINIVKGVGSQLKTGLYDLPKQAIADSTGALQNLAGTITGRESLKMPHIPLQEMVTEHPLVKDPVNYAYKNPVETAMLASTPFLPFMGGKGAAAAAPAEDLAAQMPKGEIPLEPLSRGAAGKSATMEAAEDFANNPPPPKPAAETPPPPMPGPGGAKSISDLASQVYREQIKPRVDDLGRYINRSVKTAAKNPSYASDIADLAQEKSQMMAVRAAGGGPLYATQGLRVGKTPIQINNELRAIGQYMLDNKIVTPELGNKVMLGTQEALQQKAGATLGAVRKMADDLNVPEDYHNNVLQAVDDQYGSQYAKGLPGAKQYQTALNIIQKHPETYQGMADAATELNKLANKANRNFQPHTPFTDVANGLSQVNNENIKGVVGPDVGNVYEQGLREFGVNKKIQNMLGRKVGQELHRTGPGSMTRAFYQKFMDEIGYKGGAKVLNKMAGNIKANPAIASNLPELFKSFIHEVEDVLPGGGEGGEGMAHGGIVGEVGAHLEAKYGKNEMPSVRY